MRIQNVDIIAKTVRVFAAIGLCAMAFSGCSVKADGAVDVDTNQINRPKVKNTTRSICDFQTNFSLATPIPREAFSYRTYPKIDGLKGRYAILEAPTTRNLVETQSYHNPYIHAVEDSILNAAKELECNTENKSYTIDVTIIPLNAGSPFFGDSSRPYGYLEVNRDLQTIKGQFYFNPIQIIADQYWLDEGKIVQPESRFFTPAEFRTWRSDYTKYRFSRTEGLDIETRDIPEHVMWLFRKYPKMINNTFAGDTWLRYVRHSQAGYIELTNEIIKNEFCDDCQYAHTPLQYFGSPELFETYRFKR